MHLQYTAVGVLRQGEKQKNFKNFFEAEKMPEKGKKERKRTIK